MSSAASSAAVATGSNPARSASSATPQSMSPCLSAAPTAITVASAGQAARAASRLAIALSSTIAAVAPLSRSRYSSASGPNSIDSGIATAPIC